MSSNLQKPAPMLQKRFLEDLALTGLTLEKKTVEQKLESGDSDSSKRISSIYSHA